MSTSAEPPAKRPRPTAPKPKPRAPARPNPARAINNRDWMRKQLTASRASSIISTLSPPPSETSGVIVSARTQCSNKDCPSPNVVDGTCQTCGRVAEETEIVSEVQFGETSSGQAIAHGKFLGADQAGLRSMTGPGFRRVAGGGSGEARERSLREVKELIHGIVAQLPVPKAIVTDTGHNLYKQVSAGSFVKGRGIRKVAAVCVYAACRKIQQCTIMLIDIADVVKMDVFELGRCFKAMLKEVSYLKSQLVNVFPEDLIHRFAAKLEFTHDAKAIALAAARIVQRMDRDWIVIGRKPAGICGSALIIAARMFNYRRTPLEVAYIAKVTMYTLQLRLDEFREVDSAKMSISDFMEGSLLEQQHAPPSFYKKSAEFQAAEKAKKKPRKKREAPEIETEEDIRASMEPFSKEGTQTLTADGHADVPIDPALQPSPSPVRDADGFVIPALPARVQQGNAQATTSSSSTSGTAENPDNVNEDDVDEALGETEAEVEDALASKYGDVPLPTDGLQSATDRTAGSQTARRAKQRRMLGSSLREPAAFLDEEWTAEEEELMKEISDRLNNPDTEEHRVAYAVAREATAARMQAAAAQARAARPHTYTDPSALDAREITEDEFADDPEVQNCMLGEEERLIKERLWLNENKDWLRIQQEKEYLKLHAPPKPPRKNANKAKKAKKVRIGEGQTSPASSASEAAEQAVQRRVLSKKINYENWHGVFNAIGRSDAGPGSVMGSASGLGSLPTSRAGSVLGSENGDADEASVTSPTTRSAREKTPRKPLFAKEKGKEAEREEESVEEQDEDEEDQQQDDDEEDEEDDGSAGHLSDGEFGGGEDFVEEDEY